MSSTLLNVNTQLKPSMVIIYKMQLKLSYLVDVVKQMLLANLIMTVLNIAKKMLKWTKMEK